jgi:hypothetical protein
MSYTVPDLAWGAELANHRRFTLATNIQVYPNQKTKGSQQRINLRQAVDRITVQDNLPMSAPGEQRLMQPAPHNERLFEQRTQSGI